MSTKDFILWQKAEDFTEYLFPLLDRFPKYEKFALVSQIKNQCYGLLKLIIKTNKTRNKSQGLYDIDMNLEMLRWFIRHSYKRSFLTIKNYEMSSKMLNEIGCILGGLLKGV